MSTSLTNRIRGLVAGIAAILTACTASAHDPAELDEAIRAFLQENPDVLYETLATYVEARQNEQAAAGNGLRRVDADPELRKRLENDGYSVVLGNPEGDLTLVEFFDYRCGFCARALDEVFAFVEADGGIRLVLKEFPILGPASTEAARVSIAASMQEGGERFLALHRSLFASRGELNTEVAIAIAEQHGFDGARIREDLESDSIESMIHETRQLGLELGIQGTPAFVLGDTIAPGFMERDSLHEWAELVREI